MCWETAAEFKVRKLSLKERSHWKDVKGMANDFNHWAKETRSTEEEWGCKYQDQKWVGVGKAAQRQE